MDYFAQRRQNLSQRIESEGVDAFLITNPINVSYLTGFSGDSSYLILGKARAILVSDARYTEQWMNEGKLPNLARLRAQGSFSPLRPTIPSMVPDGTAKEMRSSAGTLVPP